MVFLDLRFLIQRLKSRWGLGFVNIISLITVECSIVPSLIALYFYINKTFPIETIIKNAKKGGKRHLATNVEIVHCTIVDFSFYMFSDLHLEIVTIVEIFLNMFSVGIFT
jgi:hypothetical protein